MAIELQQGFPLLAEVKPITGDEEKELDADEEANELFNDAVKAETEPTTAGDNLPTNNEGRVIRHHIVHDVESFFWMVLWFLTSRVKHKPGREFAAPIFPNGGLLTNERRRFLTNPEEIQSELLPSLHKDLRSESLRKAFERARGMFMAFYTKRLTHNPADPPAKPAEVFRAVRVLLLYIRRHTTEGKGQTAPYMPWVRPTANDEHPEDGADSDEEQSDEAQNSPEQSDDDLPSTGESRGKKRRAKDDLSSYNGRTADDLPVSAPKKARYRREPPRETSPSGSRRVLRSQSRSKAN